MSSCFWHGWSFMPCSIFSSLPTVTLHQWRQLKLSGSHLGAWKRFLGKLLVARYSALFELVLANLLGSEAKCIFWLAWGFPHRRCSSALLQCLWWLPRLWEPVGNRLDACMCPHEHLPAQLPVTLVLTRCLQPQAQRCPRQQRPSQHIVGGRASTAWTRLPARSHSDLC